MSRFSSKLTREQIDAFRKSIREGYSNLDITITRLLLLLGFKPNLFGTVYLRAAIKRCYAVSCTTKVNFGGDIYPSIAREYNSTPRRVERDIRTAIQSCYDNGSLMEINAIAGYDIIVSQYPPTNSEFIMGVSSWLQLELSAVSAITDSDVKER